MLADSAGTRGRAFSCTERGAEVASEAFFSDSPCNFIVVIRPFRPGTNEAVPSFVRPLRATIDGADERDGRYEDYTTRG